MYVHIYCRLLKYCTCMQCYGGREFFNGKNFFMISMYEKQLLTLIISAILGMPLSNNFHMVVISLMHHASFCICFSSKCSRKPCSHGDLENKIYYYVTKPINVTLKMAYLLGWNEWLTIDSFPNECFGKWKLIS